MRSMTMRKLILAALLMGCTAVPAFADDDDDDTPGCSGGLCVSVEEVPADPTPAPVEAETPTPRESGRPTPYVDPKTYPRCGSNWCDAR